LRQAEAGRAVFVTSGITRHVPAYWGPYTVSKAALDALVRTYAAETAQSKVKVNLFNPGPIRTRMRAKAMPGEDPRTLDPPEKAAAHILPLCLPACEVSGQTYDYPSKRWL
jgi:NAD(P)-dependent dehydrogenase (short-subunit alcohol dehydrogenase family)